MPSGWHFVYLDLLREGFCQWLSKNIVNSNVCERTLRCCNEYFFKENVLVRAHLMSLLSQPGRGQRGGAQAEVWETLQWGDRNPPERCSQLHDRPWQGRGYNPPPTRAFQPQVHPSQVQISHCLCTHLRDVLFKVVFYPLCTIYKGSPFFSHLPLLFLSGRHIKRHQAPLSSSFYSHSSIFLRSSPLFVECWFFFKRGPLSARWLIVVAPAAHMHAWAEQKSWPVMSPHLMFY